MKSALKVFAIVLATPICALASLLEPSWARIYQADPSPSGTYIAKSDAYAAVVTERVFSLDESGRIVETFHQVLENISGRDQAITLWIGYDASNEEVTDVGVYIHRTITWDNVNIKKSSAEKKSKLGNAIVVVGDEVVKPGHRVVLQYVLTSTLAMKPGVRQAIWDYDVPSAKTRFVLDAEAYSRGLRLMLMLPPGSDMPANFHRDNDFIYEAVKVPAGKRLGWDYSYSPDWTTRFPFFAVYTESMASLSDYGKEYQKEWKKVLDDGDKSVVALKVAQITGSAKTLLARAKAVAAFVQGAIQYDDSNQQGANGRIPLPVGETLRSMKADCKGKVLLAQTLFKEIGLSSRPIALNADSDYNDIRDPAAAASFNHVIMAIGWPEGGPPLGAQLKDGPAKGDVLFDPTCETSGFGEPLPGFEGLKGLLIDDVQTPLFTIHTSVPSTAICRMEVKSRVTTNGNLSASVKVTDNGCAYAILKAATHYSNDDMRRTLVSMLAPHIASVAITKCEVTKPWDSSSGMTELSLDITARECLQEMTSKRLLSSPSGLAAALIGLPNGLTPVAAPGADDKIVLEPPWDYRGHAVGQSRVIEIKMETDVPDGSTIATPPPRNDDKPWDNAKWEWEATSPGLPEKCYLRMEFARGVWPQDERKMHLNFVDELLTSLYAPWVVQPR